MQLPTDLSKDILPVFPDDYVYFVDRDQGYTVRTARVAAVVIGLSLPIIFTVQRYYGCRLKHGSQR